MKEVGAKPSNEAEEEYEIKSEFGGCETCVKIFVNVNKYRSIISLFKISKTVFFAFRFLKLFTLRYFRVSLKCLARS